LKYPINGSLFMAFAVGCVAALSGSEHLNASPRDGGAPASAAGIYHLSQDRGPVRHVDLSPLTQEISSEILAGPANGLDSAFVVYTRMAAGGRKRGLYTLPVDETFLVFSGKLNVQLGTDEFVAEPETLVFVPAGVPHQVWNAGSSPEADLEVVTPAPSRDLPSMMQPAKPSKIDNAAQYIRVPPPLGTLQAGNRGGVGLNERVLASRATGSQHLLERLDATLTGGGRAETHIHPFDQVYFIRTGTMTVQYGLAKFDIPPNSLLIIPAGMVHSNVNNTPNEESHVTLLLPENPPGTPAGAGVQIQTQQGPPPPR
jgi:mannose-6-phosphate isomerase-like protein (cupin superfamily)